MFCIHIITGPINSGKSTYMKKLAERLKAEGHDVYGIIAEGYFVNGEKRGFDVLTVQAGIRTPLARTNTKLDGFEIGRYSFSQKAFDFAIESIRHGIGKKYLFIDEIGHFELEGKGYHDIFREILHSSTENVYIAVRQNKLDEIIEYFDIKYPKIFRIDESIREN